MSMSILRFIFVVSVWSIFHFHLHFHGDYSYNLMNTDTHVLLLIFRVCPITVCNFWTAKLLFRRKNRIGRKWSRGVVVITTAQLHSTKPELRFYAGSVPAHGVSEIRDGEDLWQWSRLKIKLNDFRRYTYHKNNSSSSSSSSSVASNQVI